MQNREKVLTVIQRRDGEWTVDARAEAGYEKALSARGDHVTEEGKDRRERDCEGEAKPLKSPREYLLPRSMARIVPVAASASYAVAFSRNLHLGLCSASPRPPSPLLGRGFGELFNLCFLRTLSPWYQRSPISSRWICDGVVLLGGEWKFPLCCFRLFEKWSPPTMNPVFFFLSRFWQF